MLVNVYSKAAYFANVKGNFFGGMTAAVVALPLALAFGISSGVGPIAGLYGAIVVGLCAAIFGGTPAQISGPTGPMTVVMAALVAKTTAQYPDSGLAIAFTTVFIAGCLQVVFGVLRLGKYVVMVPYPVISGFMSGIGVIIIVMELAPLLGLTASHDVLTDLVALPIQLRATDSESLTVGLIALFIAFTWRGPLNKIIPAPLVALCLASLVAVGLGGSSAVQTIGEIPSALPTITLPEFKVGLAKDVLVNAMMLSVLGSIDSLLTSLVADNVSGQRHHSDRELVGQGIGNALAGLLGGLPGAGATMRTLVNIRAGGDGPLAGVVHSMLLLMVVFGAGFLFEYIALAALAGILIKVGLDIIDWPFLTRIHRLPRFPVLLMIIVFLLTLFVDLITAVLVGVFIKNIATLSQLADLEVGAIIHCDGENQCEGVSDSERESLRQHSGVLLIRIIGPMSYASGRGLAHFLDSFKDKNLILLDIRSAVIIGISTAMVLEDFIITALQRGVAVRLIGSEQQHHKDLKRLGLFDIVGKENCVEVLSEALPNAHPVPVPESLRG